jgi:hypothetical protein
MGGHDLQSERVPNTRSDSELLTPGTPYPANRGLARVVSCRRLRKEPAT